MTAALLAGCATRANSVAPVSISANEYATLNCADSRAALKVAQERQFALTRRQNNAATADAASVFLFLLPLGSVFGADVSGELGQAKGEALALERRTRMACDEAAASSPTSYPAPIASAAPSVARAREPTAEPQRNRDGEIKIPRR